MKHIPFTITLIMFGVGIIITNAIVRRKRRLKNKQEVLLITTREDTQKFAHIQECPAVAVLIHDFPHLKGQESRNGEKTASITLKGFASIENSLKQEEFRAIHLQKNLEYKQFIVGENIRVISIRIESARICDFQDQVTHWNINQT